MTLACILSKRLSQGSNNKGRNLGRPGNGRPYGLMSFVSGSRRALELKTKASRLPTQDSRLPTRYDQSTLGCLLCQSVASSKASAACKAEASSYMPLVNIND